ncbi:MAG: hypothetical protein LDL29_09185 [Dechloromonas sp.]|nr:hypothetical protein [Dechloromonas sp.]
MRIQESAVDMTASHTATSSRAEVIDSELRFDQLFQRLASDEADKGDKLRERVQKMLESLLESILAAMDGRQYRKEIAADLPADAEGGTPARSPARQMHWRRTVYERVSESETTQVCGSGLVKTCDGREIAFNFKVDMARAYSRESYAEESGSVELRDPLVLNFDGTYCQLVDSRFSFDLDADGTPEWLPELADGSCFLVFDRNGNGRADDGSELFGTRSGNGFADLATLDEDGNRWIDEGDSAFARLALWSGDSFRSLAEAGVGALYTRAVDAPFSLKNADNELLGQIRAAGVYLMESGSAGLMQQVDLATSERSPGTQEPDQRQRL